MERRGVARHRDLRVRPGGGAVGERQRPLADIHFPRERGGGDLEDGTARAGFDERRRGGEGGGVGVRDAGGEVKGQHAVHGGGEVRRAQSAARAKPQGQARHNMPEPCRPFPSANPLYVFH